MDLTITPYEGIGPIGFGMTVDEVRGTLQDKPIPFLKSETSHYPTDSFDQLGIHVYYKIPGRCEAVEVWGPADPVLFGQHLMDRALDKLCSWLRELDETAEIDAVGATSLQFGVGLHAPSGRVEGVIVFEKGYYNM